MDKLYFYIKNSNTAKYIIILICLIYILSPFDVVHDFIPFVGRLDDLLMLLLAGYTAFQIKKNSNSFSKEYLLMYFRKDYPDIYERYNDLLISFGNDSKYEFYKKEASKVFDQLLNVYFNIIESKKRIENFKKLRKNLFATLDNTNDNPRALEGAEKSKQLIVRIDTESDLLNNYITEANEEIMATRLDFIHVTAEIELAKSSGQLVDLVKLASRSKSLSYIASNLPTTALTETSDSKN